MLGHLSAALGSIRRMVAPSHEPRPEPTIERDSDHTRDRVDSILRPLDVVVDLPAEREFRLERSFRRAWHRRIDEVRQSGTAPEHLAHWLAVDPAVVDVGEIGTQYAATDDDGLLGVWPSRAAFLADLTAAPLLVDRSPGWCALEADQQETALTALRTLLESCPNCEGTIAESSPSAASAESSTEQTVVHCGRCGSELARTPIEGPTRSTDGHLPSSVGNARHSSWS
ncbi:hypothetical protein [Natrarchaeobaculum aegyptiacum]|nr:hypothetical protein [Natrarchaeobaculum aegyptiacum]